MTVTIYSKDDCVYCYAAKDLCVQKGIEYNEIVIGRDIQREEFLKMVPNAKTVPQIFVEENYVGGYINFEKYVGENYGERNSD